MGSRTNTTGQDVTVWDWLATDREKADAREKRLAELVVRRDNLHRDIRRRNTMCKWDCGYTVKDCQCIPF